ncbi:MAG: NAD(P)/FAD-dependent oxidoreductase [Flavobacteriaceae bacterium]|nr:NAD(P)/FAD-dependent oxidoreductase [Flavobacteriaceae bacterium]
MKSEKCKIAIIGGGAAGFFAAIHVKENFPEFEVIIFEKTTKILAKVKISGGGRCNVTNACTNIKELIKAYPRGQKLLKSAFYEFNTKDTIQWFKDRNVELIIQDDTCVFPKSQQSQTIIDCFLAEVNRLNIKIELSAAVTNLKQQKDKIQLQIKDKMMLFDKVIIATGGSPKRKSLEWLEKLGHKIEEPIPSLFTFNMPKEEITKLMGIVVKKVLVSIQSTKLKSNGPLLITHWGVSGPAILKLSAFGARTLNQINYDFKIQVNWVDELNNETVKNELLNLVNKNANKQLQKIKPYNLPNRLWIYLLEKTNLPIDKKWNELGNKGINKLVNILTNDVYSVNGKTTFKEEFVTCGGISLQSINPKTMESKSVKNLYFAGELLDIDGITGGFNFQAAWTTAFIAAKLS